jgi:uncharacterized membrane protein YidH (DUF202 family)
MFFGLIIVFVGLGGVGAAYANRDDMSDKSKARQALPYFVAAVIVIAVAVVVVALVANQTNVCGPAGDGSRCSQ